MFILHHDLRLHLRLLPLLQRRKARKQTIRVVLWFAFLGILSADTDNNDDSQMDSTVPHVAEHLAG